MAETYRASLAIIVTKGQTHEAIVAEEFFFSDISFAKMANVADEFYELITKLQKLK